MWLLSQPFSLSQEYFSNRAALQMAIIYYWRMKSCWCHILQSKFSSNIHSLHYRPHLARHLWRLHFLYLSLGLFSSQNWSPTADSSSSRTQTAIIVSTPARKGTLTQNVKIASISVYKLTCFVLNKVNLTNFYGIGNFNIPQPPMSWYSFTNSQWE